MPCTTVLTLPDLPLGTRAAKRATRPHDLSASELERLIEEARRLVPMCARGYIGRGVPFDDLVGAGNVGVVEGAYRYDPTRGVKFASYAVWWIRRAMSAAVERESNLVIVPRYSRERRRRVLEVKGMNRDEAAPATSASIGAKLGMTEQQVERAMTSWSVILSLDTPTRAESTRTLGDVLAAPRNEEPYAVALSAELRRRVGRAIAALSERKRTVLALRYGFDGLEPARLTDVALLLGVSRERVRQIEVEALREIRQILMKRVTRPLRVAKAVLTARR